MGGSRLSFNMNAFFLLLSTAAATPLFPFTSFEFQAIVHESRTGPTLPDMQAAYAGEPWIENNFNMGKFQGYQQWTVPETGNYTIRADGGQGGGYPGVDLAGRDFLDYGPAGARVEGDFHLSRGDTLTFIIGSCGATPTFSHNPDPDNGAGGGGTFVLRGEELILAAGGGGGSLTNRPFPEFGTTEDSGMGRSSQNGGDFVSGNGGRTHGGDNGAGGKANDQCQSIMGVSDINNGGGGGGWSSAGESGEKHSGPAPLGGGSYSTGFQGGVGDERAVPSFGGFGGGGGSNIASGGGGGGYSGGASCGKWATEAGIGGGGGSFNDGDNQVNVAGGARRSTSGTTNADGSVLVTKEVPPSTTSITATTTTTLMLFVDAAMGPHTFGAAIVATSMAVMAAL